MRHDAARVKVKKVKAGGTEGKSMSQDLLCKSLPMTALKWVTVGTFCPETLPAYTDEGEKAGGKNYKFKFMLT